jgi:hypothetical protein
VEDCLRLVADEAAQYLAAVDTALVRPPPRRGNWSPALGGALPDQGAGSLRGRSASLIDAAEVAANSFNRPTVLPLRHGPAGRPPGPPPLAADWLTSALDQIAFNWVSSPFAMRLEQISIDWLKELFGLPAAWSGVLTQRGDGGELHRSRGGTPVVGRAARSGRRGAGSLGAAGGSRSGERPRARQRGQGARDAGHRPAARFAPSPPTRPATWTCKRSNVRCAELEGSPAILIGTAGEVNAGGFDPIAAMAGLAAQHGAWLHVDGAFGLFAAVTPATRELVAGIDRAHSVCVDGHKWLNVPYDCGAAFVHDAAGAPGAPLRRRPRTSAARTRSGRSSAVLAPEMSRRARATRGLGDAEGVRTQRLRSDGRATRSARAATGRARWTPSPSWSGWPTCR